MAGTLADYFEPVPFAAEVPERSTAKNAFIASGAVEHSPFLETLFTPTSVTADVPFNQQLTDEDPDLVNTVSGDTSTPSDLNASEYKARGLFLHKSWDNMNYASLLALPDPTEGLMDMIATYQAIQDQKYIISQLVGIVQDNIDNDSGDMVNDIYEDVVAGSIDDDNRPSASVLIDTALTMGDMQDGLALICMHAQTKASLKKQNLISTIRPSDGADFEVYDDSYRVLVDNSMPTFAGTTNPTTLAYYTFLIGLGAMKYANLPEAPGSPAYENERAASSGNGGGRDIIHSRWNRVWHTEGISQIGTPAGMSPTRTEWETAAFWNRVYQRKNINIAVLKHNI